MASAHGGHDHSEDTMPSAPVASHRVPDHAEVEGEKKIPRLTSHLPMLFVPLGEEDLTREISDEPMDRIRQLEGILATLDQQLEGVRQNVVYIVKQEKKRASMEAMALEGTARGCATHKTMSPQESDAMLQNLAETPQPDQDYTLGELPDLRFEGQGEYLARLPLNAPPRHVAMHDILVAVEFGWDQLDGYEHHMATLKKHYEHFLQKERARIEHVGTRPEVRVSSIW